VFSDIPWERVAPWVFALRPDVTFYDYTKWPAGVRSPLPANYSLTYSASELWGDGDIVDTATRGENVTVVFDTRRGHDLPSEWRGVRVVDGDRSDARYEDPRGVIVGLRAKGDARGTSARGFVRSVAS
jgi:hypothetical protein